MITVKNVLGLSFLVKGDKLKKLDKLKLKLKKLDWVTNPVRVLVMNIWGIIIKPRRLYLWMMNLYQVWKLPWLTWLSRLFTVLYFSVRSSRSSALRFGQTDHVCLYSCHKPPTRKLFQGAFKTILYPEEAMNASHKSRLKENVPINHLFHFLFYFILVNDTDVLKTAQCASCTLSAFPAPTPFL